MKKIIITVVLIASIVFNCVYVFGQGNTDRIGDTAVSVITSHIDTNESKTISRGDCITAIMKLIGMEQATADLLNYYTSYEHPVFCDEYDDEKNRGYIIQAIMANVAVGIKNDLDGICYFAPNKDATIKECLTFMLRCVKDYTTVDWNSNIISLAEEIGLLTHEEAGSVNPDEVLSTDVFNNLLDRMINTEPIVGLHF